MYDVQSNKARFIYTISLTPKTPEILSDCSTKLSSSSVRLVNGFYFSKVTRSDEKLIYTEHDMTSILRTVLCMHVFRLAPCESLQEIVYSGQVTFPDDGASLTVYTPDLSVQCIVDIVDSLLGKGFCSVVARPLEKVYSEYKHGWRYYAFGRPVALPSAADFIRLYRFVNAPNYRLSAATKFVLFNGDDHKIPLQGRVKRLPL